MSPEACKDLPTAVLDHQANALRNRLGRRVDYGERGRDLLELKNVEGELTRRLAAERSANGPKQADVKICKRVADLPGNSVVGAQHWWLKTPTKEMGMGEADGRVPGHGESGPSKLGTRMVDHSAEPKTNCQPVAKPVDADCVDRELELGRDTGPWIPGVNDCHTVVERIVDKCHQEDAARAEQEATQRRLTEADGGAP